MYKRDRYHHLEVPRRGLPVWIGRAIHWAWFLGVLGALCLAINIVKEGRV
jgi:hypothetical protein